MEINNVKVRLGSVIEPKCEVVGNIVHPETELVEVVISFDGGEFETLIPTNTTLKELQSIVNNVLGTANVSTVNTIGSIKFYK